MQNPFSDQQNFGSYTDLQKRMLRHVQSVKVNDRIFEIVQKAYEDALKKENIVLSLAERKRLLSQIVKPVLEDLTGKLNDRSDRRGA